MIKKEVRHCEIEDSIAEKLKPLIVALGTLSVNRAMRERALKPLAVLELVSEALLDLPVVLTTTRLGSGALRLLLAVIAAPGITNDSESPTGSIDRASQSQKVPRAKSQGALFGD